jgi:hypothetical protein
MRLLTTAIALACVWGCGAGRAQQPPAKPLPVQRPASPASPAPAQAQPVASVAPAASAEVPAAPAAPEPQALPDQLEAGSIARGSLLAVLHGGVGRFLQRVQAEPHLEAGRFVGWRLLRVPQPDAKQESAVLRPGDTVMRVNGQSIERPEQFQNVWDSMATSSELVLEVERGGHQSKVRYLIAD